MSDGLKLISAVLANGASGALLQIEPNTLIENERTAYDFVRGHFRAYRELPTAQTLQEETGIRLPVANESLQYYVDVVHERHEYNEIRERFGTFREGLTERNMEVVANSIHDMSRVLRRRRRGASQAGEAIDIAQGLNLVVDRLGQIRGTGGISGITTDWHLFDSITGGYQKADLITWVGRMGLGKTYIALRQAQKAHESGESVLFVTTEMATEQMARRFAALRLGINPSYLKNGTVSSYMERRIASLATSIAGSDRFKLFSVGMNARVNSIEALAQEFGPSIVFIDGVYLLKPTDLSKTMNRTERVSAVYDELKALTLEADVPFVCTTQFNRTAGKAGKEGSLENIGFSDAIGTHSSVVVALKDGPTHNPKESRTFDFLKGREGETGEVVINFKFAPLNMDEMTPEERTEEGEVTEASVEWMGVRRRTA